MWSFFPWRGISQHMNAEARHIFAMGKDVQMASREKPKTKLLNAVLPTVWVVRFRSIRRRIRNSKARDSIEPVNADSALFLPKTVENCYRHGVGKYVYSPFNGPRTSSISELDLKKPSHEKAPDNAGLEVTPGRKSSARLPDMTNTTTSISSIATNTSSTSSIFSRSTYTSTVSSLKNMCKLAGDESVKVKQSTPVPSQVTVAPTLRLWFLAGCGSIPRNGTRHGSMDLEKEAALLLELDAKTGLGCIEETSEIEGTWPRKSESWSGKVELRNVEEVKEQVVTKKIEAEGLLCKPNVARLSKPNLGYLLSKASETDTPKKIHPESDQPPEVPFVEEPKQALSRSPLSSLVKTDGTAPSELGPESESKIWPDSPAPDPLVSYSCYLDDDGVSDSQSLLKANIIAGERQREGSESRRQQRKPESGKEEKSATKLLVSFDKALGRHNLKRLIVDDKDSIPGFDMRIESPESALSSSPVFESFLESTAKAWEIDVPSLRLDDPKSLNSSVNDESRKYSEITQERERGREKTRGVRLNSSPVRTRNSKRFTESEALKKRSPSRKASPKHRREGRGTYSLQEVSIVDPELHDEFNNVRKAFNERQRQSNQRRSKQVASVLGSSPPPRPLPDVKLHGVVQERVAVVVESSYNPYNDFRESMIEMIVDQDIKETGDLEELLQCYLSLNEADYHTTIVDVFTDVWHELFDSKN